jgi:hypothetical protein
VQNPYLQQKYMPVTKQDRYIEASMGKDEKKQFGGNKKLISNSGN